MADESKADLFSRLYSLHGKSVFMLAYRMCGDAVLAEDIVQETFTRAIESYDGFRGDSSASTWIHAIAKNACIRGRERMRRGSFTAHQGLIDSMASEKPAALEEMERRWYVGQVKEGCLLGLLRCLSFYQRMAFMLMVILGLPAPEAAAILGKSVSSTRTLAARGRAKVKEFLCVNCSHYDRGNACRCEAFVSFSLKQGWIEKYNPRHLPAAIEAELKAVKNEIALYKSLAMYENPSLHLNELLPRLREKNLRILEEKK